ncbi:hypothetical protein [Undibacterium sp. TS12]|uniref:hypothetical protein n=1 Tax=Undibacterium sp. TS12 TaxID=2908202 RepID=UPI001F4C8463|nr:hypothetical protein [Undibacterium sp. TS12]MCH8622897.1 hypothetical protein [Undibacterium sp. TS12]
MKNIFLFWLDWSHSTNQCKNACFTSGIKSTVAVYHFQFVFIYSVCCSLEADGNAALSTRISNFQFRDMRAKAATEIADISDASKLLDHTEQEITKKVYRRLGEDVKPTR